MSKWKLNNLFTMFNFKGKEDRKNETQQKINEILNLQLNEISTENIKTIYQSFSNIYQTKNPQLYLPHYHFFIQPDEEQDTNQEFILNGNYISEFLQPDEEEKTEEEANESGPDGDINSNYQSLDIKMKEISQETDGITNCFPIRGKIINGRNEIIEKNFFCKVSPLLEPLKTIADEQGNPNTIQFQSLPNHIFNKTVNKINSYNNASHIEGFALFLLSKLNDNNICPHFPEFNGIINCIAKTYYHNITDEIEELSGKRWFIEKTKNGDVELNFVDLTKCEDYESSSCSSQSSCSSMSSYDSLGIIDTKNQNLITSNEFNDLIDTNNTNTGEDPETGEDPKTREEPDTNETNIGEETNTKENASIGENTKTSIQNQEQREAELLNVNRVDEMSNLDKVLGDMEELDSLDNITIPLEEDITSSNIDTNQLNKVNLELLNKLNVEEFESDVESIDLNTFETTANIIKNKAFFLKMKDYPVNYVFMEELEETLDDILDEGYQMDEDEWFAILFQVVYSLCCANYYFDLVHNDLHTSNIMFINIENEYLYYNFNNQYYRIPSNGRCVKIIDFARATLKFNNQDIISDVFHPEGEAAGQYHYPGDEKYDLRTDNTPNPSFDLVRLATTVLERIDDEIHPTLFKLLKKWCECDDGSNALYKDDSFELYIDIAHNCHNAIPKKVIKDRVFNKFKITKDEIPEDEIIYGLIY